MAAIFLGMLLSHFSKDVEKESFGSAGLFMTLWHFFWLSSVQSVADQIVFNLRTGHNLSNILWTTPELTMAFNTESYCRRQTLKFQIWFQRLEFCSCITEKSIMAKLQYVEFSDFHLLVSSRRYYDGRMKSSNPIIDGTNFPLELCQLCTNQKCNHLYQSASFSAVYSGPFVELCMSRGTFSTVRLWFGSTN